MEILADRDLKSVQPKVLVNLLESADFEPTGGSAINPNTVAVLDKSENGRYYYVG